MLNVTLIIGEAHSGKSAYANSLLDPNRHPLVIGTADSNRLVSKSRLQQLAAGRPEHTQLIETWTDIPGVVEKSLRDGVDQILVDALNQWIAGAVIAEGGTPETILDNVAAEVKILVDLIGNSKFNGDLILVASAVGGAPPQGPMSEKVYRMAMGRTLQTLAQATGSIMMMEVGIPRTIKPTRESL